jgi:peroxiredoxin Q/BCP
MMTMRSLGGVLVLLLCATSPVRGQGPQQIDVSTLGPQKGEVVPDFRLRDGAGTMWTRESIMGPNGAMLVFSRSLDWCPYCKTQVIELQSRLTDLKAQGLGVAVITYDSPAIMADFSRRRGITFPLLSDPGSRTIRAFGILNTAVAAGTSNYGIPFPGTFLIDRDGKVTSRFFEAAYQERNTISTIMIALGHAGAPAAAQRIETEHLEITSYVSDAVVAPGSLFSVVFDVKPNAGIHVYAPGANDYRMITFRIDANPTLAARALQYPASEIYHFKPLDERVPVFQKPFRLVQSMAVSTTPEARAALKGVDTVTVSGSFEYQACDDRLCFAPRSLPVSFTVELRQLDTERASVPK